MPKKSSIGRLLYSAPKPSVRRPSHSGRDDRATSALWEPLMETRDSGSRFRCPGGGGPPPVTDERKAAAGNHRPGTDAGAFLVAVDRSQHPLPPGARRLEVAA